MLTLLAFMKLLFCNCHLLQGKMVCVTSVSRSTVHESFKNKSKNIKQVIHDRKLITNNQLMF